LPKKHYVLFGKNVHVLPVHWRELGLVAGVGMLAEPVKGALVECWWELVMMRWR